MELEDEADIPVAESRQFLIAQSSCLRAIDNQPPAIRCVERAMICNKVVLPAPLGPTIATTSPLFIVRSMPFNTCKAPKLFVIPSVCIISSFLGRARQGNNRTLPAYKRPFPWSYVYMFRFQLRSRRPDRRTRWKIRRESPCLRLEDATVSAPLSRGRN